MKYSLKLAMVLAAGLCGANGLTAQELIHYTGTGP